MVQEFQLLQGECWGEYCLGELEKQKDIAAGRGGAASC